MSTIILSGSVFPIRRCYSAKWRLCFALRSGFAEQGAPFATTFLRPPKRASRRREHEHAQTPGRRYILPILAFGLIFAGTVQAQIGSSISSDGSAPNNNAMLDVQSPSTGAGKGMLIPRVTVDQRTNASASLDGGLLDNSGNLRGGAAQGLIVYQTDGSQGLYFNTGQSVTPAWVYLGASTTNYLPLTGGTMSGPLNMGAQIVSNVAHVDFNGNDVSVGRLADGSFGGAAVGYLANGSDWGAAMGQSANGSINGAAAGYNANGQNSGVAVGYQAKGTNFGAAMGYFANGAGTGATVGASANGYNYGAAMGYQAKGINDGAAVGRTANGSDSGAALGWAANGAVTGVAVGGTANGYNNGAAMGYLANGVTYGAAVGASANGYDNGAAVGRSANGSDYGAAVGSWANGYFTGAAVGYAANGYYTGAAVGPWANGYNYGAAMGYLANGTNYGAAVGASANGYNNGAAMGYAANGAANGAAVGASANGARTNVAIGLRANARGGTNHIAIGYNVTNNLGNDTAVIRGTLYLDGGSGVYTNTGFGSSSWTLKTFEIDHPLDPENKILRHYCLESPQVWNVYAGNAQLVNGRAEVQLPDYYSALNLVGAEIYSLTPIGEALVWVESEVSDGHFVIAGKRDMKVSWTIKVLRNDPGCLEDLRRRPVEQLKSELQSGQAEGK